MATVEKNSSRRAPYSNGSRYARALRPLHRVATVRRQQGVSLRSAARQTGTEVRELRRQEGETTDLLISELHNWQKVLDVPIADLLVDPGTPLSRPVMERARLVRLMKTVMSISEQSETESIQRLAQTMIDQLTEIMPELKEISAWHSVGQRRSLEEYGRAAERCISEDLFIQSFMD